MHKKQETEVYVNGHSIRFLLTATFGRDKKNIYPGSCSVPCHHPPQIHPCHSSHTASHGRVRLGAQSDETVDVRIDAYFVAAITPSCTERACKLNDECNKSASRLFFGLGFCFFFRHQDKAIHFVPNHQYLRLSVSLVTACQCSSYPLFCLTSHLIKKHVCSVCLLIITQSVQLCSQRGESSSFFCFCFLLDSRPNIRE